MANKAEVEIRADLAVVKAVAYVMRSRRFWKLKSFDAVSVESNHIEGSSIKRRPEA
jgi:hypothetical protein